MVSQGPHHLHQQHLVESLARYHYQNNVTCWEKEPLQCCHIQISWKDLERVEKLHYLERQFIE